MNPTRQTLEINQGGIYLNGDLYRKDEALQVIGHLLALNMINQETFKSWTDTLQHPT